MLKRLLTNRNRASLTGIVVRSKGFEGKVMISLETRHLHNFLSLGKVESWSRKPGNKVGDFIRSFSIGTYEIRKSKSVELFIIKWVGGKVIRAEKQRSFMETFFPLLKRENDERLLARILAEETWPGIRRGRANCGFVFSTISFRCKVFFLVRNFSPPLAPNI